VESPPSPADSETWVPDDAVFGPISDALADFPLAVPDRWSARLTFPPGVAGLGTLRLDMRLRAGEYVIDRLEATGHDGEPLEVEALRRVRYSEILPRLVIKVMDRGANFAEVLDNLRGRNDEVRVAFMWSLARLTGYPPTLAVAEDMRITPGAAAQRVRRARAAGLIPPDTTARGKRR
jgi:hypothetical protein